MPPAYNPRDFLPHYRLITGPDDAEFCYRVSEVLSEGYDLHGSPSITTVDGQPYAAQAVVWAGVGLPPRLPKPEEDELADLFEE